MQPPYPSPVATWHNDTYDSINPTRPELSQKGKTVIITGAVRDSHIYSRPVTNAARGAVSVAPQPLRSLQLDVSVLS